MAGATGSTVVASIEGTADFGGNQSLMTPTVYGTAKRTSSGIDYQRMSLLLAVMETLRSVGAKSDAFFKITGDVKLSRP